MKQRLRIDEKGWARCGKCGRKLFKTNGDTVLNRVVVYNRLNHIDLEIKCHSCKEINNCGMPNGEL